MDNALADLATMTRELALIAERSGRRDLTYMLAMAAEEADALVQSGSLEVKDRVKDG